MDTVGDAYIVAGFLPPEDPSAPPGERAAEVRRVCQDVLELSRAMLRATEAHRRGGGRDVHCRIGISLGTVMTGVLGRLQPRLHLFGEGMRAAESHEQAGEADAVHVNHAFMTALGRGSGGGGGYSTAATPGVTTVAALGGWGVSESGTCTRFGFGAGARAGPSNAAGQSSRWPRRPSFVLVPDSEPKPAADAGGAASQYKAPDAGWAQPGQIGGDSDSAPAASSPGSPGLPGEGARLHRGGDDGGSGGSATWGPLAAPAGPEAPPPPRRLAPPRGRPPSPGSGSPLPFEAAPRS